MKELALEVINGLPDDATMLDIIEALYIRVNIEKGLEDVKNGKLYTTEEVKNFRFWYIFYFLCKYGII